MKLSEYHPCDHCGAVTPHQFHLLRHSLGIANPRAMNQVLGLAGMMGSMSLAEAMAPNAEVITIAGDVDKCLQTQIFLCSKCCVDLLGVAAERANERQRSAGMPGGDREFDAGNLVSKEVGLVVPAN